MKGDQLWIDVSELMKAGMNGVGPLVQQLSANAEYAQKLGTYVSRLTQLLGVVDVDLHVEEGNWPRQDARCGRGHFQQGQQRRNQALKG